MSFLMRRSARRLGPFGVALLLDDVWNGSGGAAEASVAQPHAGRSGAIVAIQSRFAETGRVSD